MDRADTQSFIGIMVPRQQASDLGRLQSSLRSGDARFEPIPQRWLNLTLDHLGPVDPAALEAAALACARMVNTHPPFTLRTSGLRQLGSIVALMIDDPDGRLTQLRTALHDQLDAYGFTLDARPFMPHIALGRGTPALDITAPTLAFKINTVRMLTHVPAGVPGLPWQVRWKGDLGSAPQVAVEAVPSAQRDAEIRAELEARVTERAAERAALRERQARAPKPAPKPAPRPEPKPRRERSEQPERERSRSRSGNRSGGNRSGGNRSSNRGPRGRPAIDPQADRPANAPPGDHTDANAPRPKRRRRRRRPGGRSTQQTPKESS